MILLKNNLLDFEGKEVRCSLNGVSFSGRLKICSGDSFHDGNRLLGEISIVGDPKEFNQLNLGVDIDSFYDIYSINRYGDIISL